MKKKISLLLAIFMIATTVAAAITVLALPASAATAGTTEDVSVVVATYDATTDKYTVTDELYVKGTETYEGSFDGARQFVNGITDENAIVAIRLNKSPDAITTKELTFVSKATVVVDGNNKLYTLEYNPGGNGFVVGATANSPSNAVSYDVRLRFQNMNLALSSTGTAIKVFGTSRLSFDNVNMNSAKAQWAIIAMEQDNGTDSRVHIRDSSITATIAGSPQSCTQPVILTGKSNVSGTRYVTIDGNTSITGYTIIGVPNKTTANVTIGENVTLTATNPLQVVSGGTANITMPVGTYNGWKNALSFANRDIGKTTIELLNDITVTGKSDFDNTKEVVVDGKNHKLIENSSANYVFEMVASSTGKITFKNVDITAAGGWAVFQYRNSANKLSLENVSMNIDGSTTVFNIHCNGGQSSAVNLEISGSTINQTGTVDGIIRTGNATGSDTKVTTNNIKISGGELTTSGSAVISWDHDNTALELDGTKINSAKAAIRILGTAAATNYLKIDGTVAINSSEPLNIAGGNSAVKFADKDAKIVIPVSTVEEWTNAYNFINSANNVCPVTIELKANIDVTTQATFKNPYPVIIDGKDTYELKFSITIESGYVVNVGVNGGIASDLTFRNIKLAIPGAGKGSAIKFYSSSNLTFDKADVTANAMWAFISCEDTSKGNGQINILNNSEINVTVSGSPNSVTKPAIQTGNGSSCKTISISISKSTIKGATTAIGITSGTSATITIDKDTVFGTGTVSVVAKGEAQVNIDVNSETAWNNALSAANNGAKTKINLLNDITLTGTKYIDNTKELVIDGKNSEGDNYKITYKSGGNYVFEIGNKATSNAKITFQNLKMDVDMNGYAVFQYRNSENYVRLYNVTMTVKDADTVFNVHCNKAQTKVAKIEIEDCNITQTGSAAAIIRTGNESSDKKVTTNMINISGGKITTVGSAVISWDHDKTALTLDGTEINATVAAIRLLGKDAGNSLKVVGSTKIVSASGAPIAFDSSGICVFDIDETSAANVASVSGKFSAPCKVTVNGTEYTDWVAAINAVNASSASVTLKLTEDLDMWIYEKYGANFPKITNKNGVTFDGDGHSLTSITGSNPFYVYGDLTLTNFKEIEFTGSDSFMSVGDRIATFAGANVVISDIDEFNWGGTSYALVSALGYENKTPESSNKIIITFSNVNINASSAYSGSVVPAVVRFGNGYENVELTFTNTTIDFTTVNTNVVANNGVFGTGNVGQINFGEGNTISGAIVAVKGQTTITGAYGGTVTSTDGTLILDGANLTGKLTVTDAASVVIKDSTVSGAASTIGAASVTVSQSEGKTTSIAAPITATGTFTLTGGELTAALTNNGNATISGGKITGTLTNNSVLNIEGGEIANIANEGTVNISDDAVVISNISGKEIYITGGTPFISGGNITANIIVKAGHLTVDGGTLKNITNKAKLTVKLPEAVTFASGSAPTIEGTLTNEAGATLNIENCSIGTTINNYGGNQTEGNAPAQLNITNSNISAVSNSGIMSVEGGAIGVINNYGPNASSGVEPAELSIKDTTVGTIYNNGGQISVNGGEIASLNNNGIVEIEGGAITSITNTSGEVGIKGSTTGILTVNGGTVTLTNATLNGGDNAALEVNGGTVNATKSTFKSNAEATIVLGANGKTNLNFSTIFNDNASGAAINDPAKLNTSNYTAAVKNADAANSSDAQSGGYYVSSGEGGGAPITRNGASIRFPDGTNTSGIRFESYINISKDILGVVDGDTASVILEKVKAKIADGTITIGTYIIPTMFVDEIGFGTDAPNHSVSGKAPLFIKAEDGISVIEYEGSGVKLAVRAALVGITANNYTTEYSARAYFSDGTHEVYGMYDKTENSRSIAVVAAAALNHVSEDSQTAPSAEFPYIIVDAYGNNTGRYSPYTQIQREILNGIVNPPQNNG